VTLNAKESNSSLLALAIEIEYNNIIYYSQIKKTYHVWKIIPYSLFQYSFGYRVVRRIP